MNARVTLPRDVYGTEEHDMLRTMVQDFIKQDLEPHREEWEEQGYCSDEAWLKAGELGLLALCVPEEYGGADLDFSYSALIMEEMAKYQIASPEMSMHSDIVAPYILKHGSEYLKQRYLGKMVTGELIGSLAMTEPSTGSDVQAIKTTAVDKGDHYLLNGSKTFITIGYTSQFTLVACKTNPGTPQEGISLLVVDANLDGFTKGKPFKKLGLKSSGTCELFFEDVKVPKEALLGEEGKGFVLPYFSRTSADVDIWPDRVRGQLGRGLLFRNKCGSGPRLCVCVCPTSALPQPYFSPTSALLQPYFLVRVAWVMCKDGAAASVCNRSASGLVLPSSLSQTL